MATVYKAYHAPLDRVVAIKVLPAQYAGDPSFVERFRLEASTAARLRHPNILEIYDFGEQDGFTYIVNEYAEGGTLASRLGAPMRPDAALQIVAQVAAGLDYAHGRGVLHRDIKPSNIFISADGVAVIGDFGLVKILEGASGLTRAGAVLGTPQYMSPEQALGKPLDARADVYSLGVVLYEMLAGRVPFNAETPLTTLFAHIHDPLPPPRDINPAIPPEVEHVVVKALAKDVDERYASAGELAQALAAALASGKATIPPSGEHLGSHSGATRPEPTASAVPATAFPRWQLRRWAFALAAVGALAVAVAVFLLALSGFRPGPGPSSDPLPTDSGSFVEPPSGTPSGTQLEISVPSAAVPEVPAVEAASAELEAGGRELQGPSAEPAVVEPDPEPPPPPSVAPIEPATAPAVPAAVVPTVAPSPAPRAPTPTSTPVPERPAPQAPASAPAQPEAPPPTEPPTLVPTVPVIRMGEPAQRTSPPPTEPPPSAPADTSAPMGAPVRRDRPPPTEAPAGAPAVPVLPMGGGQTTPVPSEP